MFMCTKACQSQRGPPCSFRHHLLCLGQLASEPGTTCLHVNCWEYKPKPSCLVSLFICVICVCDCGSACYDIHMEGRGQILELIIPFHCVLGTKLSCQIWHQTTLLWTILPIPFYFSDLSLWINAVSVQVMCRGQRGCKTLWSWSYRWPLAAWQWCWELNLGL